MSHMYRRCSKCGATQVSNPELRMHRFPALGQNNENFYQVLSWAMFCYPEKDWFDIEAIRSLQKSGKVICSQHFDDSAYTSIHKIRLQKLAMPCRVENKENLLAPTERPSPVCIPRGILVDKTSNNMMPGTSQVKPQKTSNLPLMPTDKTSNNIMPGTSQVKPQKTSNKPAVSEKRISPRINKKYYNKCKYLLSKVAQLKLKLKQNSRMDVMQMLHGNEDVTKLFNQKISPAMALLLQGELQNRQRKQKGRRWNKNQKFLALELYKKSPRTFKLLSELFSLPSPSTLKRLLGQFILKTGINSIIFDNIKKNAQKNTDMNNVCFLTFDEMSIMKNIHYNQKSDEIEGYQDHGQQGKTKVLASHALVFMLVWIRQMKKQPVAFYFSGDYVTADRLTVLIKEVLHECLETGMNVCATVCDMDGVNVRALENLGSSVEHPYIEFEGKEIITLPDPPHLLKCFRNLFMTYDVKLPIPVQSGTTTGTGVASWKHIEQFYELDNANPHFVFAPKLSKRHIQPNGKEKMRVTLAAQLFSHSVAMGLYSKASTNELPSEAVATATLLENLNNLFDILNANSPDRQDGKPYKTNWTASSPHQEYIQKCIVFLKKIEFIGCKRTPPSQLGWLKLLNGYMRLWDNLYKNYKITSIATRRINQDPLENFFGCIRANCGSNDNPTVAQFIAGLKTSIITNLRNVIAVRNCEVDGGELVNNFRYLFSKKNESHNQLIDADLETNVPEHEISVSDGEIETSAETQACAYVCGFIFKKYAKDCKACKKAMLAEKSSDIHQFTEFKEYEDGKHSLKYANHKFIACVESSAEVVTNHLKENPHTDNIKTTCIMAIREKVNFDFLKECPEHLSANRKMIEQSATIILIKRFCVLENRRFASESAKRRLAKKIKILKNS